MGKKGSTEFFTLPSRRGVASGEPAPAEPSAPSRPDQVSGRGLAGLRAAQDDDPSEPAPAPPPRRAQQLPQVTWSSGPIDDSQRASSMRGVATLVALGTTVLGAFGVAFIVASFMLIYTFRPQWLGLDPPGSGPVAGGIIGETGILEDETEVAEVRRGGGGPVDTEPEVDPNAPGPLSITIQGDNPFNEFEVVCPGGFRNRASLRKGAGTVFNVPKARCQVEFNGGPAAATFASGGDALICSWNGRLNCRS